MKYGLFIGINQYTNGITPLKCARNDALALSKLFALNGYDVNVLLDHEANASNIRKTLRNMSQQLKNDDVFFFYFSGHGCEVNKNHYLIGQAAYPDGIDEGEETVALNRVRELTDIPGVRRLFVLDCCRNDLHGGKGLEVCPESRDVALAKISNFQYDTAEIIHPLIVTSCSTGERSYEDVEKGRGYFTQIFEHTLENKSVNTFAVFRKAIAEGMEKIQKVMKWKQTLCWHGNVDSWDEFKLFDSWNGNMQNSVVSNSLQTNSVFSEPPLPPEERMKFNDLIFSIEEFCNSMHDSPLPDSMKKSLISIQESGKLLLKQELNRKNFNQIQELHAEAESLKKSFQFYKACKKNAEELNAGKDFLKQHGITLDPEIAILEKKALFAQNRNDFEVANNIYLSAEKIISKPKEELSLNLKNIADLKAEIKQTEEQLSCSSESIHANFDSIEQLQKAESLKDYAKMISVLSAILKNNREKIRLQSAVLDSISEIKSKIAEMESFFEKEKINLPAEATGLRESAQKYFDQKKYSESEKQWKSLFQLFNSKRNDYQSYLSVKNEAEFLENKFTEKKISVSAKIREIFEKAKNAELNRNFAEAELFYKEVVSLLQDDDSAVCKIKKIRGQISQKRKMLETAGEKIPEAYRVHLQNADKANSRNEYKMELQCLYDARALLNTLENQIEAKQQAEINKLKKEFERKNGDVFLEDSLMEAYGLYKKEEDFEDYKLSLELWKNRLNVLNFEIATSKAAYILAFSLIACSISLTIWGPQFSYLPISFILPVIVWWTTGFRFMRHFMVSLINFVVNIFLLATDITNELWWVAVLSVGGWISVFFLSILPPLYFLSFWYLLYEFLWKKKAGKWISESTFFYLG